MRLKKIAKSDQIEACLYVTEIVFGVSTEVSQFHTRGRHIASPYMTSVTAARASVYQESMEMRRHRIVIPQ